MLFSRREYFTGLLLGIAVLATWSPAEAAPPIPEEHLDVQEVSQEPVKEEKAEIEGGEDDLDELNEEEIEELPAGVPPPPPPAGGMPARSNGNSNPNRKNKHRR